MFKLFIFIINLSFFYFSANAQLKWVNADADYGQLSKGFHVFKTRDSLDGKPFVAYYAIADLKNKRLDFNSDTTFQRRLTPAQFYEKNSQPLLVVNCTFFSFATHQNLNTVIKNGQLVGFNIHSIPMKGKDTFQYKHPFGSALGISNRRNADVAWLYTDSLSEFPYAIQNAAEPVKDKHSALSFQRAEVYSGEYVDGSIIGLKYKSRLKKWKMQTAVGGGPVLVQKGRVKITNNEELKFGGKAIDDKHPRTLMGYTKDNKLIIMVVQGRSPGIADGVTLVQAAKLMTDLGCVEALNLDGGGSSCMLVNGKETIPPSDKGIQRAVPAVFLISNRP